MSPTRDIEPASPTSRDLQVSLSIEQDPAGEVVALLAVDDPDGQLVQIELTGDELALLLAGKTVAVPGEVGVPEQPHDNDHDIEPDNIEPVPAPEEAAHEPPHVDEPTPAAPATYSAALDEPPEETEAIARSTDVTPGEPVVAYIRGRWQDAVVVRRDIASLLVTYSRPGSFGPVQQRITTDRVRRRR